LKRARGRPSNISLVYERNSAGRSAPRIIKKTAAGFSRDDDRILVLVGAPCIGFLHFWQRAATADTAMSNFDQ
jgi:hypothetical protein